MIKNIRYEDNTSERFEIEVLDGSLVGTYNIKKPSQFDDVDTIVDRNDEFYGVDNFILGEETELSILENNDPNTFNLITDVYNELGGDAQIVFRWITKDSLGVETSILGDDYQINLNDIEFKLELERLSIKFKIKKREEQNKFNTRIDTTVDLFSDTNLDNNSITPIATSTVYLKKIDKELVNKWNSTGVQTSYLSSGASSILPLASVSQEEFESADYPSFRPLFTASQGYDGLSLKILNLTITVRQDIDNPNETNIFKLVYLINGIIGNEVVLETAVIEDVGAYLETKIDILNKDYNIPNMNQGDVLQVFIMLEDTLPISGKTLIGISNNFQYQLKLNSPEFAVETDSSRLFDVIGKIIGQYTDDSTTLNSSILSIGGRYYDNFINSFIGLRNSNAGTGINSLKTSFESLFEKGVSKIMALGYDLRDKEVKIEDINFFFKDFETADLSNKDFERDSFSRSQFNSIHFNSLLTGYKKYSSEQEEDLFNFNTTVELTTPIISLKNKLDIESETVTDEYVINEAINDSSTATNDKDDDISMINTLFLDSYVDTTLYANVEFTEVSGELILSQYEKDFTNDFNNGDVITIESGINDGTYTISSVTQFELNLGLLSPIQTGVSNVTISITRENIIKNRTSEGFDVLTGVNDLETASNVIHNPIYQLFRWYPLWGSGLTKKDLTKEIIVNDYKNNGDVNVKVNTTDFPLEYPNEIKLNENFTQKDLQDTGLLPLFNGDYIDITIKTVDFSEFFELFNNWRYGALNNDSESFGYITLKTPFGIKKIYPFGDECFNHNRGSNTLTIKGLVKYES